MAALAVRDAFETQCLQNQRQDGQPGIPSPSDLHTVGRVKAMSAELWGHQLRVHPGHCLSETHRSAFASTALTAFTLVCSLSYKDCIASCPQTSLPYAPQVPEGSLASPTLVPLLVSCSLAMQSTAVGLPHRQMAVCTLPCMKSCLESLLCKNCSLPHAK